jgi:hypothetical protein
VNTLLVPVILSDATISGVFIDIVDVIILSRFELNWIVFGIFMLIAFIYAWKVNNEIFSRVTMVIATVLFVVQMAILSFLHIDVSLAGSLEVVIANFIANSFIVVIAILLFITWFNHKGQGLIDEVSSSVITSIVISLSILSWLSGSNYGHLIVLLIILALACIVPLYVVNTKLQRFVPILVVQASGLFFLSINTQKTLFDLFPQFPDLEYLNIDLVSIVTIVYAFYLLILGYYYRTSSDSLTVISASSSFLAIAFCLISYLFPPLGSLAIAFLLVLPSIMLFFSANEKYQINALRIQGFGIAIYALLSNQQLTIIDGQDVIPIINLVSLLFILYMGMGLLSWYRNKNQFTSKMIVNLNIITCSLITFFAIGSWVSSLIFVPSYIILGIIILILSLLQLRIKDLTEKIVILVTQAIALFFLSFYNYVLAESLLNSVTKDFIEQVPSWLTSPFITIVYLAFFCIIIISWYQLDQDDVSMFYPAISILSVLTLALIIFPTNVRVPIEFLGLAIVFLSLFALKSENDTEIQFVVFIQTILILVIGFWQHVLVERQASILSLWIDSFVIITVIYLVYVVVLNAKILQKITDTNTARNVIGSFLALAALLYAFTAVLFTPVLVHPLAPLLAILSLSYPGMVMANHRAREVMPIAQLIGLSITLYPGISLNSLLEFLPDFLPELSLYAAILVIWIILMLVVWYLRGTTNQLLLILASAFILISEHSIMNIIGFSAALTHIDLDYLVNIGIMTVISIIIILVSLLFYRKISQGDPIPLACFYSASLFAMIAISLDLNLHLDYLSLEWIILRSLVDLLVFVPILVLSRFALGRYIKQLDLMNNPDYTLESITLGYAFVFTIAAMLMGSDGFFSFKILLVAIMLWSFSITFVRKPVAWGASIFTVITAVYILDQAQIALGQDQIVAFFLVLAFIGLIMVFLAYINEKRWKGEPFTASLGVTGSLLAITSIIGPRFFGGGVDFWLLSSDVLKYLPNVTWALLGCALMFFAFAHEKSYMRKFALGVLLLDIVLSAWDFSDLSQRQGDVLILIFGYMFLGVVLILVYYVYSKK